MRIACHLRNARNSAAPRICASIRHMTAGPSHVRRCQFRGALMSARRWPIGKYGSLANRVAPVRRHPFCLRIANLPIAARAKNVCCGQIMLQQQLLRHNRSSKFRSSHWESSRATTRRSTLINCQLLAPRDCAAGKALRRPIPAVEYVNRNPQEHFDAAKFSAWPRNSSWRSIFVPNAADDCRRGRDAFSPTRLWTDCHSRISVAGR